MMREDHSMDYEEEALLTEDITVVGDEVRELNDDDLDRIDSQRSAALESIRKDLSYLKKTTPEQDAQDRWKKMKATGVRSFVFMPAKLPPFSRFSFSPLSNAWLKDVEVEQETETDRDSDRDSDSDSDQLPSFNILSYPLLHS